MRSDKRISPCDARISALVAAVRTAVLFAAPPASAQSLPAPSLSAARAGWTAALTWTHSNPGELNMDTFQYRSSTDSGAGWSSWTNISGGAEVRSAAVTHPQGGCVTFQVRAVALTVGSVIYSDPSNSVTVPMLGCDTECG